MFYTLPQAIKEEKEDEERVGISKSEKREGWKTESEEEKTREKVQRSLVFFLFFIFCLRHYRERVITGEWGFPFCKIGREYRETEFNFKSLFSPWTRKVGVPWASVVFLSSLYMYMYLLFTRI